METKQKLQPLGWVRLVIYVLSALAGLAAVVVNTLGYSDLSTLLGTIAGAGAAITGGTAAFNIQRAPDHTTNGVDIAAVLPAIMQVADAAREYQARETTIPAHAATGSPYTMARQQLAQ